MKRKILLCGLALFLVLLISFVIRALPASLPSVPETLREEYLDEDGIPYLTEMDSYFYLRFAAEMSETGSPFFYNIRDKNPLMGQRSPKENGYGTPILLSALAYGLWRFLSLFGKIPLVQVARWMGPVFGSLAAVPAFLYVKRRTNLAGGVAAGLLAGLSLPFVAHTHAGFSDTDMFLAVLPLGFVLLQLRAMQEQKILRQALCGAGGGILMGLLSMIWDTFYTYFWLLVLGGLLGVLLVMACAGRCPFRRRLTVARGWLFSILPALGFVFLFRGQTGLNALMSVTDVLRSVSGSSNVFPFIYQYTGEMQPLPLLPAGQGILSFFSADIRNGTGAMGGLICCLLAAACIPLAVFLSRRKKDAPDPENNREERIAVLTEAGMLLLWLALGVVLMRSKRRFAEISVLPAAVLAGLAVGLIARLVKDRKIWIRIPVCAALIAGCCLPAGLGAAALARSALPDVTDSMNSAMISIRETTPEDTAIASWWDYGYFMQYKARRRTIADGGTTYGEKVFTFLGKALLSEDPAKMTGILRMLEASSVTGVDDLVRCGASEAEAAEYLLRIVPLSREEARGTEPPVPLTEEQFAALLDKTHPREKVPLMLVLSEDLLRKTDAISYFGFWDVHTLSQAETSYCIPGTGPRTLSPGAETVFSLQDTSLILRIRKDPIGLMQASLEMNGATYRPGRIISWKDGVKTQEMILSEDGLAVVLAEREGRTSVLVCSPNLSGSMLVRLFFCGEKDIPGVTLLSEWNAPAVQVWKVEE